MSSWHHGRHSATSDEGYPSVNEQGASDSSSPPSFTLSAKSRIVSTQDTLSLTLTVHRSVICLCSEGECRDVISVGYDFGN
jgi:hypothetical protein